MTVNRGDVDGRNDADGTRGPKSGAADNRGGKYRLTALGAAAADDGKAEGIAALSDLLLRDDGWLRAIPDGEGKTTYLKWKFTRGRFAGTYVMVVIRPWEGLIGFRMLESKILNCYAGTRKPTRDRPYDADFDDSFPG